MNDIILTKWERRLMLALKEEGEVTLDDIRSENIKVSNKAIIIPIAYPRLLTRTMKTITNNTTLIFRSTRSKWSDNGTYSV